MPVTDVTVKLVHGATKDQAVIAEAVEGAAPRGICIGFSGVDNQRQVEVVQNIKQLMRAITELDLLMPQMGEMPIGGGNKSIIIETLISQPLVGNVFVIVDTLYPKDVGTLGFFSDVTTALQALSDNYLKGV